MDYPKKGYFDVTFGRSFLKVLKLAERKNKDQKLIIIKIILFVEDEKMLIVKMYSPYVKEKTIKLFLETYCLKVEFKGKKLTSLISGLESGGSCAN